MQHHSHIFISYCCPYGPIHAFPAIAASFAWLLTSAAAGGCQFLYISSNDIIADADEAIVSQNRTTGIGAGLWGIENPLAGVNDNEGTCRPYPDSFDVDGAMKFARMMGLISGFGSFVVLFCILLPCCINVSKGPYLKVVAGSSFALSLSTIFIMVSVDSYGV